MSSPRRIFRWLVAGLAVTMAATAFRVTESVMSSMSDHEHDWWRIFVWQLAGWGYWTLAAPVLLYRGRSIARARPWWRALPGAVGIGLGLVVVHILFVTMVVQLVQHFQPVATYPFDVALARQIASWRFVDVVAVVGITGLGLVLTIYHRARELEVNESRLEAELARAELEALRLQMQPHFLFNTLNSIAALIRRGDGDEALDTTVELGELLRETVGRSRRDAVTLADELAFVERYAALQRTRFGDRLDFHATIPVDCLELEVPTLSLQPLVENAIRHGMESRSSAIRIDVLGSVHNGDLQLSVSDDGQGLPETFDIETHAGVGLGNLRSRLQRMYGGDASLALERRGGGGTVALLSVPATPSMSPQVECGSAGVEG